jgi:hypothetical protein
MPLFGVRQASKDDAQIGAQTGFAFGANRVVGSHRKHNSRVSGNVAVRSKKASPDVASGALKLVDPIRFEPSEEKHHGSRLVRDIFDSLKYSAELDAPRELSA